MSTIQSSIVVAEPGDNTFAGFPVVGIMRNQIPNYSLTTVDGFISTEGIPFGPGTGTGALAKQDASGQWWQVDLSRGFVNAVWFGFSTSNSAADNATALAAALATGASVYIPAGAYNVASIAMNLPGQCLFGDGSASNGGTVLTLWPGSGDGLTLGSSSGYVSGIRVNNIKLDLTNASAGNAIHGIKLKFLELNNVITVNAYNGWLLEGANDVTLRGVKHLSVRGSYAFKALGTDADAINLLSFYSCDSSPFNTGASGRAMGHIIDGNVATTRFFAATNTRMGRGLWIVNTGGATNTPRFVKAYDFEADFSEYEAVRAEVGQGFEFLGFYGQGSSLADGAYIGPSVNGCVFVGGKVSGNALNGFNLNGLDALIAAMAIGRNSVASSGVSDGIAIGPTADGVTVTGNKIGRANGLTGLQRYGVSINAAALNVNLGPNDYAGNVTGAVLGASGTPIATASRTNCAMAGVEYVLASSAVAVAHTGDTTETTLATVTIPANSMGANGYIILETLWSFTNSANNKVLRGKFGGTQVMGSTLTANAENRHSIMVQNRNATNSQLANGLVNTTGGWGAATSAVITPAIDTTADVSLTITGQLANSGETITLESYTVRIHYGA